MGAHLTDAITSIHGGAREASAAKATHARSGWPAPGRLIGRAAAIALALLAAAGGQAAAGEATAVTRAAMDLRVGQIRGLEAELAELDGARIAGAALEGVVQVRRGDRAGSAAHVTVQWNALSHSGKRVVLAPPAVSTFDLLTSTVPGATPIVVGDATGIRAAMLSLGVALPAPAAAGDAAGAVPGTAEAPAKAEASGAAAGPPSQPAGASAGASNASGVTNRPTPNYAGTGTGTAAAPPAGQLRTARPTPAYGSDPVAAVGSGTPATPIVTPPVPIRGSSSRAAGGGSQAPTDGAGTLSTATGTPETVPAGTTGTAGTGSSGTGSGGTGGTDTGRTDAGGAAGGADAGGTGTGGTAAGGTGAGGTGGTDGRIGTGTDATVPLPGAPIETATRLCEPVVDLSALTVVDRFRRYRLAPDGAPTWVDNGCLEDRDTMRPIGTTVEGCAPLSDLDALQATELRRRVYDHPAGGRAYAGPCLLLAGARQVPITYTPLGCRLQHEWESFRTIGLVRPVFVLDGVEHQAGACADRDGTPVEFLHQVEACSDLVLIIAGVARRIAQHRTLIMTSPPREIVPCQPVPTEHVVATGPEGSLHVPANAENAGRDLVADGCDAVFAHDLDARVSFATRRWYWREANGLDLDVDLHGITGCVANPHETYEHAHIYSGWRHDDAARVAWHQVEVSVELPGLGTVAIASGLEPDGPEAYARVGRALEPTAQRVQIGCDLYAGRRWVETLERPDGSTLQVDGGVAAPALAASCRAGRIEG